MSIFEDGNPVGLEEIFANKTVQRFLRTLLVDVLFFTGGQVNASFRGAKPANSSVHRFDRRLRYLIGHLEEAKLVGTESVERLPPVTARDEPIFTWCPENPLPNAADLIPYADAAANRVPPLAAHTRTRLYFARSELCSVLRSLKIDLPPGRLLPAFESSALGSGAPTLDPIDAIAHERRIEAEWRLSGTLPEIVELRHRPGDLRLPYRYEPWPGREPKFRKVLEWHLAVEGRSAPSAHELARTHLTAHFNLNHLRFLPRFRPAIESGECEFFANSRWNLGNPDGDFGPPDAAPCDLYFLRPLAAHEIRHQLDEYVKKRSPASTGCWWV